MLNRNALILGPSFLKAKLEGAKNVPPVCAVVFIFSKIPVFVRPSVRVLNSVGKRSMIFTTLGGGKMMLSTPWMTPLVPNWRNRLV